MPQLKVLIISLSEIFNIGAANILQKMNALSLEDRNIKISNLLFDVVRNNGKFLDIDSGGLIAT